MRRPVFFLSSTIHDFSDLRSALKYYLEAQGCQVLASEYNDFRKNVDENAYKACLQSIQRADYFILLIGSRVGAWFDERNRVSITQREYQEAYRLHQSGNLKIMALVRSQVWDLKENRNDLIAYLKTVDIPDELQQRIAHHRSKFADDASFIIAFINEVSRASETKAAVAGTASFPTANWIHVFHDFREIIDVIQAQIFAGVPVEESAFRKLLELELIEMMRRCLLKVSGKVLSPRGVIDRFEERRPVDLRRAVTEVAAQDWDPFHFASFQLQAIRLSPVILEHALRSTAFLRFDGLAGAFQETELYRALYTLHEEIRRFNEAREVISEQSWSSNWPRDGEIIRIPTSELTFLLCLAYRWDNIIRLATAICKHLNGSSLEMPLLRPRSPVAGMDRQLAEEQASGDEVRQFIQGSI